MDLRSAWAVWLSEHDSPMEWNVRAGKKRGLMPGEKTFSIPVVFPDGKTKEAVWRLAPQILDLSSVQKYIYGLVIRLLEDGELHRLRSCPQCQKFFVAEDRKREFCSESCRVKLGNKERLDSGYFTNLRHKKRRTALARARRLLQEGKPLEEIMKETRLSERILRKARFTEG